MIQTSLIYAVPIMKDIYISTKLNFILMILISILFIQTHYINTLYLYWIFLNNFKVYVLVILYNVI